MSDPVAARDSAAPAPRLPVAAVDITAARRALDAAAALEGRSWWSRRAAVGLAGVLVLAALAALAVGWAAPRVIVATALIVLVVGSAVVLVAEVRTARERVRRALDDAASAVDAAVDRVVAHLASIGYEVPPATALDWVTTPVPAATAPLNGASTIAARWWHPAEGDDRVFVEPFLRRGDRESSLPAIR